MKSESKMAKKTNKLKSRIELLKYEAACFLKRNQGLAAVEFAMILPFMVTFTLGSAELMLRFQVSDQFKRYTFQVADLVTRYENSKACSSGDASGSLTPDVLEELLDYAADSMNGTFTRGDLQLNVASIGYTLKNAEPRTLWSRSYSTGAVETHSFDTSEVDGMGRALETIIRVNMTAAFETPYSYLDNESNFNVSKTVYFRPRIERVLELDCEDAEQNKNWETI
jgi:hypothetical protein